MVSRCLRDRWPTLKRAPSPTRNELWRAGFCSSVRNSGPANTYCSSSSRTHLLKRNTAQPRNGLILKSTEGLLAANDETNQLKPKNRRKQREYEVRHPVSCRHSYFPNAEHSGFGEVRQRYADR